MKNLGKNGHSQGVPKIFWAPIYGVHCVVIFAIAFLLSDTMYNVLTYSSFLYLLRQMCVYLTRPTCAIYIF